MTVPQSAHSDSGVTPVDASPPLDVAVLLSESAARLGYLLDAGEYNEAYDVVAAVASHPDGEAVQRTAEHGLPTATVDIEAFYEDRAAPIDDMSVRQEYDRRVAATLDRFDPDLVVCSGYRFVLTEPVLEGYAPGLISVHHADLTLRDEDGEPLYPGLCAVEDALLDGRTRTRETVHVVTEALDRGPPLAVSRPFEVNEALVDYGREKRDDVFDAYVYAHREWMMGAGGGPTLVRAVELLAEDRVSLRDGRIYVDGDPGPDRMGETPKTLPPTVD